MIFALLFFLIANNAHIARPEIHRTGFIQTDDYPASIYYDVLTKQPFRVSSIENQLVAGENIQDNSGGPVDGSTTKHCITERRIGYRSNGCTCQDLVCGCCAGIMLQQFNFSREGCMNFTYDPNEFSIAMDMYMDQNNIFSTQISAKNPPPFCVPIAVPYLPTVDFCAKLFDVHTPGNRNLHMCLDLQTRISQAPVLVLHFDCMRIGSDGLQHFKPGSAQPVGVVQVRPPSLGAITSSTATIQVIDVDTYDEVTEIKYHKRNRTGALINRSKNNDRRRYLRRGHRD